MTNPPAGSESKPVRTNVQGNLVVATREQVRALRRLSSHTLSQLFLHAKEQGSAMITLDDQPWTIERHSDHTFTLTSGFPSHSSL
jgi:transcriptional regulator of acetoin/glycerol metabolism